MGLEAHQHFKVRSSYFNNKEISAVIFVTFPTCYHPIRVVTLYILLTWLSTSLSHDGFFQHTFHLRYFEFRTVLMSILDFSCYTKLLAGLTDPDVSEESDELRFLRNTSSKAIISLRRRVVSSHISLEVVIPLCGKIIYLLQIYNIFPSTQQYDIFT